MSSPSSPWSLLGVPLLGAVVVGLTDRRVEIAARGLAEQGIAAVHLASSVNGWPASPIAAVVRPVTIAPTGVRVQVREEVAPRFSQLLAWFHAQIEPVRTLGGYNFRPIRGYGWDKVSNHGSATAIDINADAHPLGARGTFSADKAAKIRAMAAQLGMRWGGDYHSRADEMHFEIDFSPPASAVAYSREQQIAADRAARLTS